MCNDCKSIVNHRFISIDMYHHYITVTIVLSPSHHLNLCQAINREMAPEYTDDQEEGEHVHHSQTRRVLNYQSYNYRLQIPS